LIGVMGLFERSEVHMAVETIRTTGRAAAPLTNYPSPPISVGLLLIRVPLGFFLASKGISHIQGGLDQFVKDYIGTADKFMSHSLGNTYLNTLPWVEIAVGCLLAVGLLSRVMSLAMSVMLLSFVIAIPGKILHLPFDENLVFLGAAAGLIFTGGGEYSVDGMLFGRRRKVTVTEEYVTPLGT